MMALNNIFLKYRAALILPNFSPSSLSLSLHFVKSANIRSCSGPYFPAFGLNTERYFRSYFGPHFPTFGLNTE